MNNGHLEIFDLWHKYGSNSSNNHTLKSIDLNIKQGEIIGLVGPSGCGKTTLLRLIAGFDSPSRGKIILSGREIASPDRNLPPERRGVSMVFQDYALFPHLTVLQNVCFGMKGNVDKARAEWLLDLIGLSSLSSRFPHELSGGQKQRLALARALGPSPSIVLLDEPFNSLDLQVRLKLRTELFSVLKAISATAIFVTHDSSEALAICDKVAIMRDGTLIQYDSPRHIIDKPIDTFIGEFISQDNVLPIQVENDSFISPIGAFSIKKQDVKSTYRFVMFDPTSVQIARSSSPNAEVKSIEFCKDHYLITLKSTDFSLRVWASLDHDIELGDKCYVNFMPDGNVSLFPGCVKTSIAK